MSLARLNITEKSRKVWTCGNCGDTIPKGSKVIHFTVGYRGIEHHRCGKTECYPLPSERESSAVSSVYAAQEQADFSSASSLEDIEGELQAVADACEEVASEYESNEMYDINADLQERAETVREAGENLMSSWADGLEEEPQEEDFEGKRAVYEDMHEGWLEQAREAAESAVNDMELP